MSLEEENSLTENQDNNDEILINKKEMPREEKKLSPKKAENGKYGYVDESGSWAIEPKFDQAAEFVIYDDTFNNRTITLAIVNYQDKWGVIKPDSTWHISPEFNYMDGIEGEYEFVPTIYKGEPLEGEFNEVCSWMIAATYDNKRGIIDIDGNWIVKPFFEEIDFTPSDDDTIILTAFNFNSDIPVSINRFGEEI